MPDQDDVPAGLAQLGGAAQPPVEVRGQAVEPVAQVIELAGRTARPIVADDPITNDPRRPIRPAARTAARSSSCASHRSLSGSRPAKPVRGMSMFARTLEEGSGTSVPAIQNDRKLMPASYSDPEPVLQALELTDVLAFEVGAAADTADLSETQPAPRRRDGRVAIGHVSLNLRSGGDPRNRPGAEIAAPARARPRSRNTCAAA